MSILTGTVPYYGAKRDPALKARILAELGPHRGYWEAQCGSLAVLLGKKPAAMEVATDLNGDVINLARVLASAWCDDLYRRVRRTLVHAQIFEEAQAKLLQGVKPTLVPASIAVVDDEHVERAYWFLVASWQGINGVTGTHRYNVKLARRFTVGGGHGGTRWRNVADSMPYWHERLRNVLFDNLSCFEYISKLADDGTWVIYSDPPYYKKCDQYEHDWTPEDHEKWAAMCRAKRDTRIVVSYYDHPEIRKLYKGWTVVDCSKTKTMVSSGRREKSNQVKAPEILLINGPSFTDGHLFTTPQDEEDAA